MCWCTAAEASSDGIGTRSGPISWSEMISIVAPSSSASSASAQIRSIASCMPSSPSASGQVASIVTACSSGSSALRSRSMSSLVRIGWSISIWKESFWWSESSLPLAPRRVVSDITTASRTGSIAGFVTCAKRCLK